MKKINTTSNLLEQSAMVVDLINTIDVEDWSWRGASDKQKEDFLKVLKKHSRKLEKTIREIALNGIWK